MLRRLCQTVSLTDCHCQSDTVKRAVVSLGPEMASEVVGIVESTMRLIVDELIVDELKRSGSTIR